MRLKWYVVAVIKYIYFILMKDFYCETHKSVNTKNIYGMLLGSEEIANKA